MGLSRLGTPVDTDAGSIVIGWLTRIVVVMAIIGLVAFDAMAIAQGHVSASDEADEVAQDAHNTWSDTHDVDKAYATADGEVKARGDRIPKGGFTIEPKTGYVTVKVQHSVDTLLAKHFGFSRAWATMVGVGHAQDVT
jgi:hypothetical protein